MRISITHSFSINRILKYQVIGNYNRNTYFICPMGLAAYDVSQQISQNSLPDGQLDNQYQALFPERA
jgi:hypothetical protein